MSYLAIKYLHVSAALLSISGFILRGYWMIVESRLLTHRATRVVPHAVDAILLLTGIIMLVSVTLNPATQPWLLAKFTAIVAYVLLGTVAIKRGPTKEVRMVALVGAIACFAYIAGVALSRSPASWLAWLA